MTHPLYGEREIMGISLKEDGWFYMEGFRFHGEYYPDSNIFKTVWDLEEI